MKTIVLKKYIYSLKKIERINLLSVAYVILVKTVPSVQKARH